MLGCVIERPRPKVRGKDMQESGPDCAVATDGIEESRDDPARGSEKSGRRQLDQRAYATSKAASWEAQPRTRDRILGKGAADACVNNAQQAFVQASSHRNDMLRIAML